MRDLILVLKFPMYSCDILNKEIEGVGPTQVIPHTQKFV